MRVYSILVTVALVVLGGRAGAAPAAEVVIVWAPGHDVRPIETVAQKAGAAVIDRSPAAPKPAAIPAILARGIEGYDKLRYDDAQKALDEARDAVDRTGAEGMTPTQLSDLFVYRALLRGQNNDPTAFDDFATAIVIDPSRSFDPARFAPDARELLERAQTAVAGRPRATLVVDAPAGCAIAIDGIATEVGAPRVAGSHWVRVSCADHAPWGARVELGAPSTTVVARPVRLVPPSDPDLLIQARVSGSTAIVVAEVRGEVATARLIGLDGRERDRRTVVVRGGLGALADGVRELLRPPVRARWYRSKWTWAIGAAILAAAIAIPITAAATRDAAPSAATIRLPGDTW